jgi:septum site-determining protein MinC
MSKPELQDASQAPFELKGSMLTITVMRLRIAQLDAVARHLAGLVKQAPAFFQNAPLLFDLSTLHDAGNAIDFAALADLVRRHGLVPVAVRGGTAAHQHAAIKAGLGIQSARGELSGRRLFHQPAAEPAAIAQPPSQEPHEQESAPEPAIATRGKLIEEPIRAGQKVYAPGTDLIILATVNAGAEVLADGNIHVYGALRGRALAGVRGDRSARIFCQRLEAELVSVAGHYRVSESLDAKLRERPVQIRLDEERLMIQPL